MDYEEIKQLMKDMENSKLESINIELSDGTKISMKKPSRENVYQSTMHVQEVENLAQGMEKVEPKVEISETVESTKNKQENLKVITSPMVGTFYEKASPSSKPFVKVGDKVKKGDVLCIIEAMKLMNEIESDVDGEIVEICCKEETLVEYGTVLFKIL